MVAEPEKPAPPIFRLTRTERIRSNKWPSYQRGVNDAPLNHDKTGPDISRKDFTWCMTAINWGHGIEATAEGLMEESSKALRERRAIRPDDGGQRRRRSHSPRAQPGIDRQAPPF